MFLMLFLGPQSLKYLLSDPLQEMSAELTEKSKKEKATGSRNRDEISHT